MPLQCRGDGLGSGLELGFPEPHLTLTPPLTLSLTLTLTRKQERIPYRDSKLTRLLQESLGGRCN